MMSAITHKNASTLNGHPGSTPHSARTNRMPTSVSHMCSEAPSYRRAKMRAAHGHLRASDSSARARLTVPKALRRSAVPTMASSSAS
eukprot:14868156-Alexandrium_andersonii.AAC.1